MNNAETEAVLSTDTTHVDDRSSTVSSPATTEESAPVLFLIILDLMILGGIEVLAIKIAENLTKLGHKVIVTAKHGPVLDSLSTDIQRIPHNGYTDLIGRIVPELSAAGGHPRLVLISLHPWALVVAQYLSLATKDIFREIDSFHLVTHSRAFFFNERSHLKNWILKRTFFSAPSGSTYFMNEAALRSHSSRWNTDLDSYPILRLPGASMGEHWKPRPAQSLSIVSVGRLVPFKGYNRAAPRIVRALRDAGIDATWDIWGYGPEREFLETEIERHGVADYVSLKGELPYARFAEAVLGSDVFVGMGTALLEAAELGVPSLTAIEMTEEFCYGFFGDSPMDSVGDYVAGAEEIPLTRKLIEFSRMSEADRLTISMASASAARRKSSSVEAFSESIVRSEPWPASAERGGWRQSLLRLAIILQDKFVAVRVAAGVLR